jgi:hypothetical protein
MAEMATDGIPEYLAISPLTLVCPLCGVKAGRPCETSSGEELELVHLVRIKAAAAQDLAARKTRRAKKKKLRI